MALAAQGLDGTARKRGHNAGLVELIDRLGLLQIDSVNVLARSHYLPLHARLGSYSKADLDALAWGKAPQLFEYWAHEASLLPVALQPLLRWRMEDARHGATGWLRTAHFLSERADLVDRALAEIRDRGPLAASELQMGERGAGGWWGWSEAKRTVECLFAAGRLAAVTRRGNFERVYGLPENVFAADVLDQPTPSRHDAQRELLTVAANALGIATEKDLRDYFRLNPADTKRGIATLVEEGTLIPVTVEGWPQAYRAKDAALPKRIKHQALLSPFDNAIWHRDRTERLFDMRFRLEIYTPAAKRVHGYYVLPFLEDDAITARVDLKADRAASALLVKAAHSEPGKTPKTAARLASELRNMADWLGLEDVRIDSVGGLAAELSKASGVRTE
jgi:uncharacterized protein